MAQTASPPALAPRLPEGQGKADLTDYAASAKAQATTKKYMQDLFPGQNKPLPALRDVDAQDRPASAKPSHSVQKRYALEERVLAPALENRPDPRSLECLIMLDQSSVGGTEKSSASTNPTTASSPLSRHHSNATQVPSTLTRSVKGSHRFKRTRRSLLQLPQGILGHILAYVFAEERAISITPYQPRVTPQRRRLRHGPNAVDIRSFMMHPALLVCHQMRNMGLHILYHDNLFLIDLCDANSASHTHDKDMGRHDMGKYWDCWTNATPPQMVQTALTHASNIRIELPVPGAETAMARGTTKRKKDSQEDKGVVLESLRRVTALIIGSSAASPPERPRAPSPPAPKALRRKLSFRSAKRHDSLEFVCRGDSPPLFVREPLSTLEVVLVKPAVAAEVHSQTLEMVTMCSSIPVAGNLEYHLELEGLRKLWAKRTMGQWLGSEPDGSKLLHDLRSLGHPRVKTECVQNSGRPREARAQPVARSGTTHRQRSRPTQPSSTTGSSSHRHVQVSLKEGSVAGKFREMEHLCKITFLKGSSKSPPTVGELQQIASDIRRGVY